MHNYTKIKGLHSRKITSLPNLHGSFQSSPKINCILITRLISIHLHKPARRRYKRSRVIVFGIDEQFQADLVDLQNLIRCNKGYKYLLTCIDIFSKYAFVLPLKTKQGQELVKAFQKIISTGRKPINLQTDQGTEFLNRVFQKFLRGNNIDFFYC